MTLLAIVAIHTAANEPPKVRQVMNKIHRNVAEHRRSAAGCTAAQLHSQLHSQLPSQLRSQLRSQLHNQLPRYKLRTEMAFQKSGYKLRCG